MKVWPISKSYEYCEKEADEENDQKLNSIAIKTKQIKNVINKCVLFIYFYFIYYIDLWNKK
jgi:hypothetical protein